MIKRADENFIRSFSGLRLIGSEEKSFRVIAKLKSGRVVRGFGNGEYSAYIAGVIDGPKGKRKNSTVSDRDRGPSTTPISTTSLRSTTLEGVWSDYVIGVGVTLHHCSVHEEKPA
jgi:hypothetical protein